MHYEQTCGNNCGCLLTSVNSKQLFYTLQMLYSLIYINVMYYHTIVHGFMLITKLDMLKVYL